MNSPKFTIRYLARLITQDMRTTAARTLGFLEEQCHVRKGSWPELMASNVKSKLVYASPKPGDEWTISLASNLLQIRMGNSKLDGFSNKEVEELLHYICTN